MAYRLGYKCQSSAVLRTDHDPILDGSCIRETQLSDTRKRQRTDQHIAPTPPSKRQKKLPHHSSGYINTPAFWDSLSKIWLTKRALREFNRRNSCPHSQCQVRRPTTRNLPAKQKNISQRVHAADFLCNSSPKRLRDIKLFARHGGPDLSDLVGYQEPIPINHKMSSSMSSSYRNRGPPTSRTRTTERTTTGSTTSGKHKSSKTSNPNDANYQQNLIDGGVFPYGYEYPNGNVPPLPPNWDETHRKLAQPRPYLSPATFSEKKYRESVRKDARAFSEDTVKDTVLPVMLESMGISKNAEKGILFTNIYPLVDGITQAKPDYYYGAQPEQIHSHIRNDLSKHIIPSNHTHLPAVPNFFLEVKGPDGSAAVARRQACYDGAIGARAMQSLCTYRQSELVYNNNIYTISSTYHEGTLMLYGHSSAQPNGPGTRPEYYMHQLNTWSLTGNKDAFVQGATAFKNAIDLTEKYRNNAIVQGNKMGNQAIEDKGGDEGEGEERVEEDTDNDEEEAKPSATMLSF